MKQNLVEFIAQLRKEKGGENKKIKNFKKTIDKRISLVYNSRC